MTATSIKSDDRGFRLADVASGSAVVLNEASGRLAGLDRRQYGWLIDASRHLHQAIGPVRHASMLPDLARTRWFDVLGDYEHRITSGTLNGSGWVRIAYLATDLDSSVVLPPTIVGKWARILAAEAMSATNAAYITRAYSLAVLLGDPHLGQITRSAIDAVVSADLGRRASRRTDLAGVEEATGPDIQPTRGRTSACRAWDGLAR